MIGRRRCVNSSSVQDFKRTFSLEDEIDSKSNGVSTRCDSHNKMIYRSCQTKFDWFSSKASSIGSRYLGSLFRNLVITLTPRTLHNVFRIQHIADGKGDVFGTGAEASGRPPYCPLTRQRRNAPSRGLTSFGRRGSSN